MRAVCCVVALFAVAQASLRASHGDIIVTTTEDEVLAPDRNGWIVPRYGQVRLATGGAQGPQQEDAASLFKPEYVPAGHISGQPEPTPEPEPVKPAMVGRGELAAQRMAELEAERAKLRAVAEEEQSKREAKLKEEQDFVCRTVDVTRQLVISLYDAESKSNPSSEKQVLGLISAVCPALHTKAPHATKGLDCEKIAERISHYYDPKYEGEVGLPLEAKCAGESAAIRNYALAQALHNANSFFRINFCADVTEFNPCAAAADATGAAEPAPAEQVDESVEAVIAEAESAAVEADEVIAEVQKQ